MTEPIDLAKIKDRIAKLLAMAGDSSSPNEAAIAAGRARALMDKYQVDEFDVKARTEDTFQTTPAFDEFFDQLEMYKNSLTIAVATYNDCVARYEFKWIDKPRGPVKAKRIILMGFASDVELAQQMYARLEGAIIRLRKEWFKESGTPYSHRLRRNFDDAAAYVISQRLKQLTAERDTITHVGAGTALMVIKQAAVAEHFGETKYRTSKAKGKIDQDGWKATEAGRIKGAMVEIVPLMESA